MKTLLAIAAAASVLVGCATSSVHHGEKWEYKVAAPLGNPNPNQVITKQSIEPFLNNMAKEGWIFIVTDSIGWFYFKRMKP